MAKYKGIQGYSVQKLSDDPTASSDTEGQFWYNSSLGKFKVIAGGAGAWSSGGDLNTARSSFGSAKNATLTTALIFGGDQAPPPGKHNETESYDGTTWTEVNNLTTARLGVSGAGLSTAALAIGGNQGAPVNVDGKVEEYDGTSWTEGNDMTHIGVARGTNGTTTAALASGGTYTPGRFADV